MRRIGKGRILAGLVSLVMLMCALSAVSVASATTGTPGGYLAGEHFWENVDHEFDQTKLGGGTAVYKSANRTLTLNGVNLNLSFVQMGVSHIFIYTESMKQLTVELQGTNTIACKDDYGILMEYTGGLTIKGSGTLSLTTGNDAIAVPNEVVVTDGATLILEPLGDHSAIYSGNMNGKSDVTLQKGANVTISSEGTASAVSAYGNINIAGGSTLTINGPAVSKARAIPVAMEAPNGNITVANSTLNVTGKIEAKTGITLQDASGLPTSEVIVDGGIQPAPLTVRPATGTWMQVHASAQAGGDLEVEDYFTAEKTYPDTDALFNQGYVHIKAHEHVAGSTWNGDMTSHWKECSSCGALMEEAEHAYGEWELEELTHWKQCSICGIKFEESHNATTDWQPEEDYHWYGCTTCGAMNDMQDHNFVWTVDQAPTATTPGLQHGVCTVCGYTKDAVEIPPTANPSGPNPPAENPPTSGSTAGSANVPKTGDNTPVALWLTLLLASGAAIAVLARRKLYDR